MRHGGSEDGALVGAAFAFPVGAQHGEPDELVAALLEDRLHAVGNVVALAIVEIHLVGELRARLGIMLLMDEREGSLAGGDPEVSPRAAALDFDEFAQRRVVDIGHPIERNQGRTADADQLAARRSGRLAEHPQRLFPTARINSRPGEGVDRPPQFTHKQQRPYKLGHRA
jgi:hypothetical protein